MMCSHMSCDWSHDWQKHHIKRKLAFRDLDADVLICKDRSAYPPSLWSTVRFLAFAILVFVSLTTCVGILQ
jgi:hypothetical protein